MIDLKSAPSSSHQRSSEDRIYHPLHIKRSGRAQSAGGGGFIAPPSALSRKDASRPSLQPLHLRRRRRRLALALRRVGEQTPSVCRAGAEPDRGQSVRTRGGRVAGSEEEPTAPRVAVVHPSGLLRRLRAPPLPPHAGPDAQPGAAPEARLASRPTERACEEASERAQRSSRPPPGPQSAPSKLRPSSAITSSAMPLSAAAPSAAPSAGSTYSARSVGRPPSSPAEALCRRSTAGPGLLGGGRQRPVG